MLRLFALALLLSTTPFAAHAQLFNSMADPRSVYDWSGFYLGVQMGWGWADQHIEDNAGLDADLGLKGEFFGPTFGYQKQFNNFVVGAEVEANWSDIDGQDSFAGAAGRTFGNVEIFGSLSGKVGYAWRDILIYGSGGLAGSETGTLQRNGPFSTEDHAASFGWMAGAGVDVALTDRIVLGLQYRHYDLGEADFSELGFIPKRKGRTDTDAVIGQFKVRFGGP
jgi:outer membrane immunogenic protein